MVMHIKVSQWRQRVSRLIRIYQNYRKIHPGIDGFWRLANRCIDAILKGGLYELRGSIAIHEWCRSTDLQLPYGPVMVLEDVKESAFQLPDDVAVHAHVYYVDLATELRSYLANIPVKFHFYVTTDTLEKAKIIEDIFADMENSLDLSVNITENRGRDIFPMLVTLGGKLIQHEIVLHIHTKRSPHNSWLLGGWRRYLMESLLGNPQRVTAILQQFMQDEKLGIFFPDIYSPARLLVHMPIKANDSAMNKLLHLAGKKEAELKDLDRAFFPAGDMFWFRGKAIKSFVEMNLSAQDFEPEEGQVDATLAHAIERMFPYFASEKGMITKSFSTNSFLSRQCSAHQFDLLYDYIERGLILNPLVLFDHNIGGGTNIYTRELVNASFTNGSSALRVYHFDGVWFVQWIAEGDGMLFYTRSVDELFKALIYSGGTSVIVNSLNGCPDIKVAVSRIVGLVQALGVTLDVKMHDFYALCPSPHLLNFKGEYCGVPMDLGECCICLNRNPDLYHSWYPRNNIPVEITEWRKPFAELLEAATTVSFFDQSSVGILCRAFKLEESKIRVVPHTIDYFNFDQSIDITGPLHIGILGTLTYSKGGEVVKVLSEYIDGHNLNIPITVIGSSYVNLPSRVNVYGNYTQSDLPSIISQQGINVVLMPSIVPETFSYTISEAIKMGLPIVAFDLGAQGNRVKLYELGRVVSIGSPPKVILTAIQSVLKTAKEIKH